MGERSALEGVCFFIDKSVKLLYSLTMQKNTHEMIAQLRRIARKKSELDKRPNTFGTDVEMLPAEMYLVEILGANEGLCMTRIAEIMQITKGAVSQTFKKLEKKSLVKKYHDPANASRSLLYLSKEGKKTLNAHEKWHKEKDGGFTEHLKALKPEEALTIRNFLNRYEFFLDSRSD